MKIKLALLELAVFGLLSTNGVSVSPAQVDVYVDSVIGLVNPLVFGSGDEMNENFSQAGAKDLIKLTKPAFLRFGGIASEYYDWEGDNYNGVWYIDFIGNNIIPLKCNFGTDSILRMCEFVGAEPLLSVNTLINDPAKAARWVEYCNGDTNTPMGRIRAERGHPQPYNVEYWSLGNEPDIAGGQWPTPPWGCGHFIATSVFHSKTGTGGILLLLKKKPLAILRESILTRCERTHPSL